MAAFLATGLVASPALACTEDEGFLFSCETTTPGRSLMLCGRAEDGGEGLAWTTARLVYLTERGDELSLPEDPALGPKQLLFSHRFRNDLYEADVRFMKDGASFRLFFRDKADDAGADAGLEISRDGKPAETLMCGESPLAYFDQIRKTLACDLSNPHGALGCSNTPPNIK